ncbi:hypothetical protein T296_19110 [Pantoea agglomerans Eh318]|nr:hypothetical protein T296_19110 [Pantoea agglomerans Eh318]
MLINKPRIMARIKILQVLTNQIACEASSNPILSVEGKFILTKLCWFIKNHIVSLLV